MTAALSTLAAIVLGRRHREPQPSPPPLTPEQIERQDQRRLDERLARALPNLRDAGVDIERLIVDRYHWTVQMPEWGRPLTVTFVQHSDVETLRYAASDLSR